MITSPIPCWSPDQSAADRSQMRAFFAQAAEAAVGATPDPGEGYGAWHRWSIDHPAAFWSALWRYAGIISSDGAGVLPPGAVLVGGERMAPPDPVQGPGWFPGASLNFAENLLRRRDDAPALIFVGEGGDRRVHSFAELHAAAGAMALALLHAGVRPGDRVAGFLPNIPETVIAMLGAAWIGAVWSSCSPDFGVQGVLDRFGQIEPVVLIAADGYRYNGKEIDLRGRVREIARALPAVRAVVVVPFGSHDPDPGAIPGATGWADWLAPFAGREPPPFARLPFDHPLYVMYSSGTTGLPKGMIHGAGGTLVQHLKEHLLHGDLRAGERIFYFTTCGWMMWNWLVSALAAGATLVLYDGAPLAQRGLALWDLAANERVSVFGTSARFLAMSEKLGVRPAVSHDLGALRLMLSTGSPLSPASFDYVARDVKPGLHVASISGGTDLISCFALGNPLLPVWRGELQAPGLGMAVDVFGEDGRPLRGAPGELVCTRPFPSMPVAFWNDDDGARYRAAYFDVFPGVWRHGDWAELTAHGGMVIHGRSDATLNPGGVRIGTAEIYRLVETFPEILESVVVGVDVTDASGADVRIALFVRPAEGAVVDEALLERVRGRLREEASPHHVPRIVRVVSDIPRTVSGKLSEIAVREALHGRPVKNAGALANPESLAEFVALGAELRF